MLIDVEQSPIYGGGPVVKRALIVCPVTLINNWNKEFRKWLGKERIGVLVADSRANIRDFTHGKVYSIMVIGYEKVHSFIRGYIWGSGGVLISAELLATESSTR